MHVVIVPSEHFVTARYPLGGIFQLHQATALHRAGHQVGVVASGVVSPRFLMRGYPYPRREQMHGFPVFRLYERRILPARLDGAANVIASHQKRGLQLYKEYTDAYGRPDVIHAHNSLAAGFVAHAIHERDGTPYIVTEHSSLYATGRIDDGYKKAIASCARDASSMTVVSTSLARDVKRVLASPDLEIGVLQNTLDPLFAGDAEPNEYQVTDRFTFLNIGSLDANKDHASLIKAFAERFRDSGAQLRIGGEGGLRAALERLAREVGVESQVTFLGPLDRRQVRREMQSAGCFVLTSRHETFGVVLVEALACGTPVVATRCGGPEDIVHSGNGLLVEPGDVAGIGAAMTQMIRRRQEYRAAAIRKDCLDRFGEDAFVSTAIRYYEKAAGGA